MALLDGGGAIHRLWQSMGPNPDRALSERTIGCAYNCANPLPTGMGLVESTLIFYNLANQYFYLPLMLELGRLFHKTGDQG